MQMNSCWYYLMECLSEPPIAGGVGVQIVALLGEWQNRRKQYTNS